MPIFLIFILGFAVISAVGLNAETSLNANVGLDTGAKIGSDVNVNSGINVNSNTQSSGSVSLSDGNIISVQLSSQEARTKAESELDVEDCSNCEISLVEINVKGESRAVYRVTAEKEARVFGLFKTTMNVYMDIDVETSTVIAVHKPWWGFLASESSATVDSESETEGSASVNSEIDEDWCDDSYASEIYSQTQASAQVDDYNIIEAKSLGFVDYNGQKACHVYIKTEFNSNGKEGTSETDIYSYSEFKSNEDLDATIISKTNIDGQLNDYTYKFKNGICVSGNGCSLAE